MESLARTFALEGNIVEKIKSKAVGLKVIEGKADYLRLNSRNTACTLFAWKQGKTIPKPICNQDNAGVSWLGQNGPVIRAEREFRI